MKYGDILLSALRKMFLNKGPITIKELSKLKEDKNYKTYLDGIHLVVNECLNTLLEIKPYIQNLEVTDKYNLSNLEDFKRVYEIYDLKGTRVPYHLEGESILRIDDNDNNETYTMYYESYYYLEEKTSYNEELPIARELCNLIPLYLAAELYKDDDNSLATTYMNEFEVGLQRLKGYPEERKQIKDVFGVF